jgi:hypothetical protein
VTGVLWCSGAAGSSYDFRVAKSEFQRLTQLIDVENFDATEILLDWVVCDGDPRREYRNIIFSEQYT